MALVAPVLVAAAIVGLTAYLLQRWFKLREIGHVIDQIPGPPTVPIFGNALTFKRDRPGEIMFCICTLSPVSHTNA